LVKRGVNIVNYLNRFEGNQLGLKLLHELEQDPPPPTIAIVGCRTPDQVGTLWSSEVSKAAVNAGWLVVSGGAKGIDSYAHRSAINAGGSSLAILGCGMGQIDSRLKSLCQQGVGAVSSFPYHHPPKRWTYPKRNVEIATLCDQVIVIQASEVSGSLYTARKALSLGKPVWTLPHHPDQVMHRGCLKLLTEGAKPLLSFTSWLDGLYYVATDSQCPSISMEHSHKHIEHSSSIWQAARDEPKSLETLALESSLTYSAALLEATQLELEGWLIPIIGVGYQRGYPQVEVK
jgi:DNA processing protein